MNAQQSPTAPSKKTMLISWIIAILTTFFVFYPRFTAAEFKSGDTWSYLALSDSIFTDFYRVTLIRDFQFHSFYPAWFPPLFPTVLALARMVWDKGVYTGFFLNIVILLLVFRAFNRLTRTMKIPYWCGLFCYCSFLCFDLLLIEAERSRGMPLAILVFCTILNRFFLHDGRSIKSTLLLGLLAGLGPLSRYDQVPIVVCLGFALTYLCKERRPLHFLTYFCGLTITLSPWILYSLVHFHKPFISDNTSLALIAEPSTGIDYYYTVPQETLFTKPGRWIYYFITIKLKGVVDAIFTILFSFYPLSLLFGVSAYHFTKRKNRNDQAEDLISKKIRLYWIGMILGLVPVSIGGYGIFLRYFTIHTLFLFLTLLYYVREWLNAELAVSRTKMLLFFGMIVCIFQVANLNYLNMIKNPLQFQQRHLDPHQFQDILAVLDAGDKSARMAFVNDGILTQKFSALTKRETISFPVNLTPETFKSWAKEYKVTHIMDKDDYLVRKEFNKHFTFEKTAVENLYRLVEKN